jgi:hypothetical protein
MQQIKLIEVKTTIIAFIVHSLVGFDQRNRHYNPELI